MPVLAVSKPWSVLVADPKHGPLPALLLALTVVTGLVDAVSVLSLGRVFVANMTGNVVFVGFALAGAPGFSLSASLFALAGFLVGAWAGGLFHARAGENRGRLLFNSMLAELALLAIAAVVAQVQAVPYSRSAADAIAGVAAVAMGLQNATARQLAVPDLTTSVVTMTLTGLATEVRARNRSTHHPPGSRCRHHARRRDRRSPTGTPRPSVRVARGRGWTRGRGHAGDGRRHPPPGRLAVRLTIQAPGTQSGLQDAQAQPGPHPPPPPIPPPIGAPAGSEPCPTDANMESSRVVSW